MYDKLKLSIFEELIKNTYLDIDPIELTYYTKHNGIINFEDCSGLKQIKLPIGNDRTKKNVQNKKEHPSSKIIGSDLLEGYDDYVHPELSDVYQLEDILQSIKFLIECKNHHLSDFKFITLRRHLHKLMRIPIEKQECKFNVIYWKGLIFFMYDYSTEEEENDKCPPTYYQKSLQYAGLQFEKVVTDHNNSGNFYTVVSHSVNDVPIIYTAEIDCATQQTNGLEYYIECKTHFKILDDKLRTTNKFNKKVLSTYIQNKFINCNHYVFGFRTSDIKLSSIKIYNEEQVTNLIRSCPIFLTHQCSINTNSIFQWYDLIINWITSVKPKDELECYTLSFHRADELMDSNLTLTRSNDDIFLKLIPKWFIDYVHDRD